MELEGQVRMLDEENRTLLGAVGEAVEGKVKVEGELEEMVGLCEEVQVECERRWAEMGLLVGEVRGMESWEGDELSRWFENERERHYREIERQAEHWHGLHQKGKAERCKFRREGSTVAKVLKKELKMEEEELDGAVVH